jgi:TPR repeat protein
MPSGRLLQYCLLISLSLLTSLPVNPSEIELALIGPSQGLPSAHEGRQEEFQAEENPRATYDLYKAAVEAYYDARDLRVEEPTLPVLEQRSIEWWKNKAHQGEGFASFMMGFFCETGRGSGKKVTNWFMVGKFFNIIGEDTGWVAKQSNEEAMEWYHLAADQGDAHAQFALGLVHEKTPLVVKTFDQSQQIPSLGEPAGRSVLHIASLPLYFGGVAVWTFDDSQEREKSDKEAFKWYHLAAVQGYARAQFKLGEMYQEGRGVKKSKTQALKWYQLAANQGHPRAGQALKELQGCVLQ